MTRGSPPIEQGAGGVGLQPVLLRKHTDHSSRAPLPIQIQFEIHVIHEAHADHECQDGEIRSLQAAERAPFADFDPLGNCGSVAFSGRFELIRLCRPTVHGGRK